MYSIITVVFETLYYVICYKMSKSEEPAWVFQNYIVCSVRPGFGVICLRYLVTCSPGQTSVAEQSLAYSVFPYSTSVPLLFEAIRYLHNEKCYCFQHVRNF